jgi:hypothetical protein
MKNSIFSGVTPPATADFWEILLRQTICFAEYQVNRLQWRGQFGGVLPEGYDPNSSAAQAIIEFLGSGQNDKLHTEEIRREINHLVLRHVTRLHHLKENWLLSNKDFMAPVFDTDDDPVSSLEFIPAPEARPDQSLIERESTAEHQLFKSRFSIFLGKDRRLQRLFEFHCDGIARPQLIAARLRLSLATVKSLKKRLKHKWTAYSDSKSPAEI